MTTLETLNKLAKYADTMRSSGMQHDLIALFFKSWILCVDSGSIKEDIYDFYGTPDKAPAWLRVIANADPGNLDQARAEARAEFAKELDAMEVEK
jgi:hypothetical protein